MTENIHSGAVATILALFMGLSFSSLADEDNKPSQCMLRYTQPAKDWEKQALPIGNGRLGAMIFGGVAADRIQFNEESLWTGGAIRPFVPDDRFL